MANPGERSINIVRENKPKVLLGLGQKGHCSGYKDSPVPCHGHSRYRWTERASPIRMWLRRNMETPYASRAGKVSRKASRQACGQRRMEEANAIL
jgi:hypothetical protein